LYEAAASLPWEEHLTPSSTFSVDATLRGSEQTHSGFVALKVKDAIVDRMRQKLGSRPNVNTKNPDVRVVVHLSGSRLSLALDLAGDALHRRGYRLAPTEAPLKETLAAAMLRAAGYSGEESVLDPMCGSGTLLIEAAMIAIKRAPGALHSFGVERWPHQGQQARTILAELRSQAASEERQAPFPIVGYDRDAKVLEAARRNVAAAKLRWPIRLQPADATQPLLLDSIPPGLLITNPPYGSRLKGSQTAMKSFYFKLGENLRQLQGWRLFVLAGNPAFESAFHRKPASVRTLWNGPIECRLLGYRQP
jgi:putative N6-adenine-specific DNA methylase